MLETDKRILEKILKYCNKIDNLICEFRAKGIKYIENDTFQLATDMCVFQIGELSIHVSENFKLANLNIPWVQMKGMRNIHAHEYDNIDREKMWNTLLIDIPDLKNKIIKCLN